MSGGGGGPRRASALVDGSSRARSRIVARWQKDEEVNLSKRLRDLLRLLDELVEGQSVCLPRKRVWSMMRP
jgi:hypothetical protein